MVVRIFLRKILLEKSDDFRASYSLTYMHTLTIYFIKSVAQITGTDQIKFKN